LRHNVFMQTTLTCSSTVVHVFSSLPHKVYRNTCNILLSIVYKQNVQVAQLSQIDRAAEWVSYDQKWKTVMGDNIYGHYRTVFNHCGVASKQSNSAKKRKIKAVTPFKVI